MKLTEKNVLEFILRCDVCGESKNLNTDFMNQGHSLEAALFIADEFDKFHDEECEN